MLRKPLLASVIAAAFLIGAPAADATIFCVPNPAACPSGVTGTTSPDLTSAMSTNSSDFNDDTVYLGSGTFTTTGAGFSATGFDHLVVIGAGKAQTILTSNAATSNTYVFDMANNSRPITMKNLTFAVPDSFPTSSGAAVRLSGNIQGPDVLDGVDIHNLNLGSFGIWGVDGNGSFLNGRIYGLPLRYGVVNKTGDSGSETIDHASIENADFGVYGQANSVPVQINHSVITDPVEAGVLGSDGVVNIHNSVIRTNGAPALQAEAFDSGPAAINADHLTMVGDGTPGPALSSFVNILAGGGTTLNVSDSIMRGYSLAWERMAPVSALYGDANLTIDHSNFVPASATPATETDTGDGSVTLGAGNINADPLFISAGDLALGTGSPSIDAGDPAGADADDFVGTARPLDGNGDGTAVSDQGAFEHAAVSVPPPADTTAPNTKKGKGPKAKITARKATVRFSSTEAGSHFQCRIDKGKFAGCKSPKTYKKLKLGKHKVLVRAIDTAGNVDATPVKFAFRVARPGR